MFLILLFLDMRNIIPGHVSIWWYILFALEDTAVGVYKSQK